LEGWQWLAILGAMITGIVAGDLLSGRVPAAAARRIVTVIAYLGAVATLGKGLMELAAA
jgi:uncharacterized protein